MGILLAVYLGLGGGFLGGLVGVPLVVLASFVSMTNINREQWCSCINYIYAFMLCPKCYNFFVLKRQFDMTYLNTYLSIAIGTAVGIPVGNEIGRHVSHASFRRGLLALILFGSVLQ